VGILPPPAGPGPGDADRPEGRRSPLAVFPPGAPIPGLLGWFEVAEDGRFSTPWVPGPGVSPARLGIDPADLAQRQAAAHRIEAVLIGNRLAERGTVEVKAAPPEPRRRNEVASPAPAALAKKPSAKDEPLDAPGTRLSQAAFERLAAPEIQRRKDAGPSRSLGSSEELALDSDLAGRRQAAARNEAPPSAPLAVPAASADGTHEGELDEALPRELPLGPETVPAGNGPVRLFDVSHEPFRLARLDSGHLVLFRRALKAGEQVIQGLLLEQGPFISGLVGEPFAASPLAGTADLSLAHRGELLTTLGAQGAAGAGSAREGYAVRAQELSGELLLRARPQEPFGALELIFSSRRLPVPPGASAIGAIAAALALVLLGGTWLLWRLGARQIALAGQQQAFVSAVSHELKTPLTSIRMYTEMLRAGFADEARRETYYRYIHEESERLSRLIANVLQLSRMSRGDLRVAVRTVEIAELMDLVRERVTAPAERAGFRLELRCAGPGRVQADPDAFLQVLINLVDNALKFAARSEPRLIEIGCERLDAHWWRFRVRDYGPGVPKASRREIFRLFYRGEEAIRQAIPGTGIGLALVQGLTLAMGGRVTVVNREPGAELCVDLRSADGAA
jgi:two-component system, OmpR family, phosphate regulon sensor histidine kinase PhoR